MLNALLSAHRTASRHPAPKAVMVSLAALVALGGCDNSEQRALALASISQCNNHQPALSMLTQYAGSSGLTGKVNARIAMTVAQECYEGVKGLRKFYPDHPCLPFMESSVALAELAHESYVGTRPLTSADLSVSRFAQNRAACLASKPPLV